MLAGVIDIMAHYRGFLSYSHADKAIARRLLGRLQTYRLPKGAFADGDRRLGDFFMDRDSLPVAGNLSDAIVAGLSEARALIVLCSPEAAASKWVQIEIETFRELHPDGEILAIIVSGDPQARDHEGCFPPALLAGGQEPLAADFRAGADGPKLGFLKLAAALSGGRLETLLQRDQTRQRRRVIAVTAVASVVALGMSTLAAVAVTAQKEAEARRAEAEGLVDFMITDLKDRLEPVGRLDVLDGVASEVLDYYEGRDEGLLDCAQVVRKVGALQLVSRTQVSMSDFDQAERNARLALDLSRANKSNCQGDPSFAVSYGHSAYYVAQTEWGRGDIASDQGDLEGADRHFDRAIDLYEEYDRAILPLHELYTQEAADNQTNFGAIYFHRKELEESRRHFEMAITLIEPLALLGLADGESIQALLPSQKTAIATLANSYGWLGSIAELQESFAAAIEHRKAESRLYVLLAGTPPNRDWNHYRNAIGSKSAQVRIYRAMGQTVLADEALNLAIIGADALAQNDPNNQQWQDFRVEVYGMIEAQK